MDAEFNPNYIKKKRGNLNFMCVLYKLIDIIIRLDDLLPENNNYMFCMIRMPLKKIIYVLSTYEYI